ncbi:MAG TPA: hypothetical protein VGN17_09020 [Bryobacteraceae bacterium]|jgi:hypothetical protein
MGKKIALLLLCPILATAQIRLISARAGTLRLQLGRASVDGKPVRALPAPHDPPQLNTGQRLHVNSGRVEMRLGPAAGVTLLQGSTLRLRESHLDDVQVELEEGSALIRVDQVFKGGRIRVMFAGGSAEVDTVGWYRFDANPERLRVYQGTAEVSLQDAVVKAKKGQAVSLTGSATGSPALAAFHLKDPDPLVDAELSRARENQTRQRRMGELAAMQRARRVIYADEHEEMNRDRDQATLPPPAQTSGTH